MPGGTNLSWTMNAGAAPMAMPIPAPAPLYMPLQPVSSYLPALSMGAPTSAIPMSFIGAPKPFGLAVAPSLKKAKLLAYKNQYKQL